MGHDYGVSLRFLSVTPTRDNEAASGNRLVDKHSRLFHGKTLDEWLMIQLWSSKYSGTRIFVCETDEHRGKLAPLAEKYGVELYVRPRDMLHPVNDSGGIPIMWAARKASASDWHSLFTSPFVVAPCRPPGFFDMMVEEYLKKIASPDWQREQLWVMGGYETDAAMFELDEVNHGTQLGTIYLNKNPRSRLTCTGHWMASWWWWDANWSLSAGRHDFSLRPTFFDIEPWMDCHIDTAEHWEEAEYWFAKKILSQGEDCYERYRETWSKDIRNGHNGLP